MIDEKDIKIESFMVGRINERMEITHIPSGKTVVDASCDRIYLKEKLLKQLEILIKEN